MLDVHLSLLQKLTKLGKKEAFVLSQCKIQKNITFLCLILIMSKNKAKLFRHLNRKFKMVRISISKFKIKVKPNQVSKQEMMA